MTDEEKAAIELNKSLTDITNGLLGTGQAMDILGKALFEGEISADKFREKMFELQDQQGLRDSIAADVEAYELMQDVLGSTATEADFLQQD